MKHICIILLTAAVVGCGSRKQLPAAYTVVCDGEGHFSFVAKEEYIATNIYTTFDDAQRAADFRRKFDERLSRKDAIEIYDRVQAMNWKDCEREAK